MIVFPSFASSNCGMLKTVRIVDDQVVYGFPLFGFTMKYMYCTLTSFITNEVYIHNVSYPPTKDPAHNITLPCSLSTDTYTTHHPIILDGRGGGVHTIQITQPSFLGRIHTSACSDACLLP